jgi:hypothetical protein
MESHLGIIVKGGADGNGLPVRRFAAIVTETMRSDVAVRLSVARRRQ